MLSMNTVKSAALFGELKIEIGGLVLVGQILASRCHLVPNKLRG